MALRRRIWHGSVEHSTSLKHRESQPPDPPPSPVESWQFVKNTKELYAEALKQTAPRLVTVCGDRDIDPALRPTASPAKLVAELERLLFSCETCGLRTCVCSADFSLPVFLPVGSVQLCSVLLADTGLLC